MDQKRTVKTWVALCISVLVACELVPWIDFASNGATWFAVLGSLVASGLITDSFLNRLLGDINSLLKAETLTVSQVEALALEISKTEAKLRRRWLWQTLLRSVGVLSVGLFKDNPSDLLALVSCSTVTAGLILSWNSLRDWSELQQMLRDNIVEAKKASAKEKALKRIAPTEDLNEQIEREKQEMAAKTVKLSPDKGFKKADVRTT